MKLHDLSPAKGSKRNRKRAQIPPSHITLLVPHEQSKRLEAHERLGPALRAARTNHSA